MENELDLTLKLGLPNRTVETHLSLNTSTNTEDQAGTNVVDCGRGDNNNNDGGRRDNLRRALWGDDVVIDNEGASNDVDINIRVYNYVFQQFAGAPNTLNFDPYPMPPSPAPAEAPVAPAASEEYVMIDVPARRAHRNNIELMANAWNESPNAYAKRLRGCSGYCGGRVEGTRKCTNMKCNALTTPMWRRGPLGPKSLCNACGIKFRKEEERKFKKEEERKSKRN